MIKQVLLLVLTTVAGSQLGVAATCTGGSLQQYINLGSTGCTIGGDTLYNFQTVPGSANNIIPNGSVNINPSGGTYTPGISIMVNQTVADLNSYETIFTYDISGPLYTSISATLSGAMETNIDGGVTGLVNFCEGGSFGSDGVTGCTKPNNGLVLVDGVQNSQSMSFPTVSFLNVTDDFEIDGAASGGTLTNSFTAVPEPIGTSLAGFGLVLLGALKVRSTRLKTQSK